LKYAEPSGSTGTMPITRAGDHAHAPKTGVHAPAAA